MERRPRLPRWLGPLVRLVLTVVAVAWISRSVRPGAALAELRAAPAWVFAVPAALLFVNAGLHSLRLVVLLGGLGVRARVRDAFSAIVQAQFAGLVLPRGGGDVVKVAWLAKATGRLDAVLAALAVARLIEVVPWLLLLLYGLAWGLAGAYPLLGTSAASFAALFAAGLAVAVLVARLGDRLAARLPIGREPALRFARALRALTAAPRALALASLLVVPTAALNVLSVWLVLRGYGVPMPLSEAAAVVPAADTVISLPVTVAGLGLREGVFVTFLAPWGVPESRAVAAAFTRWTGELARAAVGGVLFVASGRLRGPSPEAASGGAEEE
jgi:uncharacterized membrane protein YbhN (UPF0104 family)